MVRQARAEPRSPRFRQGHRDCAGNDAQTQARVLAAIPSNSFQNTIGFLPDAPRRAVRAGAQPRLQMSWFCGRCRTGPSGGPARWSGSRVLRRLSGRSGSTREVTSALPGAGSERATPGVRRPARHRDIDRIANHSRSVPDSTRETLVGRPGGPVTVPFVPAPAWAVLVNRLEKSLLERQVELVGGGRNGLGRDRLGPGSRRGPRWGGGGRGPRGAVPVPVLLSSGQAGRTDRKASAVQLLLRLAFAAPRRSSTSRSACW